MLNALVPRAAAAGRHFIFGDVPGVLWSPAGVPVGGPLVLIGHGGGQHKAAPGVSARAHRYVTACGFSVAALDAPDTATGRGRSRTSGSSPS